MNQIIHNTMLFPILILILFTLFVGFLGIPFNQDVDILSKWLTPSINLLHQNSNNSIDWYEFCKDAVFSVKIFSDKIKNAIYDWSYNRGYIDAFYGTFLTAGVRKLAEFTHFFDRRIIDGIPNRVGFMSFFVAEVIKSVGGGRISSYLFFYFSYVSIFLLIYYFLNLEVFFNL
ncbi:putative ATP-polyphosphate phosphotransferase [Helianthus annuus]|nr:putative ATP-polyphosphate phosphotransferase [Helianthus annuus]